MLRDFSLRFLLFSVSLLTISAFSASLSAQPGSDDPAERAAWMAKQLREHIEKIDAQAETLQAPDFPEGKDWFNSTPLSFKKELRGKVTILDFWTYCCINCIHVLPDLAYLEKKYAGFPVAFVGVHSAKFENEKVSENIRQAVLRYEIHHPVINDDEMTMWRQIGIRSWPSIAVIGPKGNLLLIVSGEGNREVLDAFISIALEFYKPEDFSHDPLPIKLEKRGKPSPLRFPGKLVVDADRDRLYISDSNHHRIVVTTLEGKFVEVIGSGRIGLRDGGYEESGFNRLQGLALDGNSLWVADAENHALRRVDLERKSVVTVVGDGEQGRDYEGGGSGSDQRLSTPWDVVVDGDLVYIAMAGTHQIWIYHKGADQCYRYSGSGRELNYNDEDPVLAAWAQPSGLSIGRGELFVADSESSSIRSVQLATGATRTIVGGEDAQPQNLFAFGDVDGKGDRARLQHPLGVLWSDKLERVLVADTYNHRIKLVNLTDSSVAKWIGGGKAGMKGGRGLEAQFDEPSGLAFAGDSTLFVADTNNHAIRVIDLDSLEVSTLELEGIPSSQSPVRPRSERLADLPGTPVVRTEKLQLAPGGAAKLSLKIELPEGHEWLPAGGSQWQILAEDGLPAEVEEAKASGTLGDEVVEIPIVAVKELTSGVVRVEALAYFCKKNDACKVSGVVFEIPIEVAKVAGRTELALVHALEDLSAKIGGIPLPLGETKKP